MSGRRVLTLYPYLLNDTCWVFDDEHTGLKEEAFVMGMTEMISRVVEVKGIRDAARGFTLSFSDAPFDGHDVELHWIRPDEASGNWYGGTVAGERMEGWLCPALLLYFEQAPPRIFVRCDPLPAGVNPIWTQTPGQTSRQFVAAPQAPALDPVNRYSQITSQLHELEGKTDPESRRLYSDLIDELMCVDWAIQPSRHAMARSAKQKPDGAEKRA